MEGDDDQLRTQHEATSDHTTSLECHEANQSALKDGNSISKSAKSDVNSQQADGSDLEVMETDDEEIEEITVIELSDTEIREEEEDEDSDDDGGDFVIKEEPMDDYECQDGVVNFDPSQLGLIVTETELPDDLIGGPVSGMYKCKFCPQKFPTKERLIAHIERHIVNGSIRKCRFCEFYTAVKQTLLEHECKHTKEKPYCCNMCSFRCRLRGDLTRHLEVHTNIKRYECKECGHRTRTAGNLRKHMDRHWPDMPRNFVCPLCGFAFKRHAALKLHLKRRHNDNKPFFCDQCSFCSKTLWELKSHKAKHSNDHPYQCNWPGCGKAFKTKSDCTKHSKRHTGVKNYECSICGKGFFNAHLLRKHAPAHSDVRNFECGQCLKRFKTLRALKGHLMTHMAVKPFSCNVCYKTFGTQFNLDMHKHVHEGGRPYQCPICVHGSREMEHLMAHVGSEHLHNFTYVCGLCRKPFGKSMQLQLHLQRCHKEDMRGRDETVVYDPDYLDHNFEPEASGCFEPSTFAKYLATETQQLASSTEMGTKVKQEPRLNDGSGDSGVSSLSSSSPEESSMSPEALKLPPVVQLGRYGGIPFCLARKNSGIKLNCQKKGKKPECWFMDMSQMTEADAERHREYLRKKELGLLPQGCRQRRKSKMSVSMRKKKMGTKHRFTGKRKGGSLSHRASWTDEDDDSDEDDAYLLAQQLMSQLEEEGTGYQGGNKSQRCSSRARKPAVHFKNLPDDYFNIKLVSANKKGSIPEDTKPDLGLLQSTSSRCPRGKAAHRMESKPIMKKRTCPLAKCSKKSTTKKASFPKRSKKNLKMNAKPGRKKKATAAGTGNCWALALAEPLPVSHYKPEESFINTQCWLNAVRSSATRGQFGLTPSKQNSMDAVSTSLDANCGDSREDFFSRCLQLQVKIPRKNTDSDPPGNDTRDDSPRDNTGDSLPGDDARGDLPGDNTRMDSPGNSAESDSQDNRWDDTPTDSAYGISDMQEIECSGGPAENAGPEVSEACSNDYPQNMVDMSLPEEAQVHYERPLSVTENNSDDSMKQTVNECVVEAAGTGEDASHQVPLPQNSDDDFHISSRDTVVEANNVGMFQIRSDVDQSKRELCSDVSDGMIQSCTENMSSDHVAALEGNNVEGHEQDGHFGLSAERIEDNSVLGLQHVKNVNIVTEGDSYQFLQKRSQDYNCHLEDRCGIDIHFEANVKNSAEGSWPEMSRSSSNIEGNTSKDKETDASYCNQDGNSLSVSAGGWQKVFTGLESVEREPHHHENITLEERPLPTPQCEERPSQGKSAEVLSTEMVYQSDHSGEADLEGSIIQKESKGEDTTAAMENYDAVQQEQPVQQVNHHGPQLKETLNRKDKCLTEFPLAKTSSLQETVSETTVELEKNISLQLGCLGDNQAEFLCNSKDARLITDEDNSNLEKCEGNKENTVQGSKCIVQVSHAGKTDLTAFPKSQSLFTDTSDACSFPHLKNTPKERKQVANSQEEITHGNMAEDSANELLYVQSTKKPIQFTKCLHVLVLDTQIHPCSVEYLHSLGIKKVCLNVYPYVSKHKIQKTKYKSKIFKGCQEKKVKSESSKKIKQAVSQSMKQPRTKKQKAKSLQQKGAQETLVRSPRVSTEHKPRKQGNEPLMDPVSNGSSSNVLGISGLLLASASTPKTGKPPAETSSKFLSSRHKKSGNKSASTLDLKQRKISSRVKRPISKAKLLASKTSVQEWNANQLHGSKKQKQRKENTACSLKCAKVQDEGESLRLFAEQSTSLMNTGTITLEMGDSEELDVATELPSVQVGRKKRNIDKNSAQSTSKTHIVQKTQTPASEKKKVGRPRKLHVVQKTQKPVSEKKKVGRPRKLHVVQKTQTPASEKKKVGRPRKLHVVQKTQTPASEKKKVGRPRKLHVVQKTQTPASEKKKVGRPRKLHVTEVSLAGFHSDEEAQVDGGVATSISLPEVSDDRVLLDANVTGCGRIADAATHACKSETGLRGCSEVLVAIEPLSVSDTSGNTFCVNKSTSGSDDMTVSNESFKLTTNMPDASIKKSVKSKLVKWTAKTRKKTCAKQNKNPVKETAPCKSTKGGRGADAELWNKIKQPNVEQANPETARQQKMESASIASSVRKAENSAFKITKTCKNKEEQPISPGRKKSRGPSWPSCEKDVSKKRKKFMYVETDTGEFPDPPAKKRGRPPGPKIILDRSQANLCFDQALESTEQDQTGMCIPTEASYHEGEVSSSLISDAMQPAMMLSEAGVVYCENENQVLINELPPQFVQSAHPEHVPELSLSGEAYMIQACEGLDAECTPERYIASEVADIKPNMSELSAYVGEDVKPSVGELSVMNSSATSQIMPACTHPPAASWITELQDRQKSAPVAALGKVNDARADLLQVLTSHLGTYESGPFLKNQSSQLSVHSRHPYARPGAVMPSSFRGRKRKSEDRTFQVQHKYRQVSSLLEDAERRRSDRRKKLRLTEEQIRLAAGEDSLDSDVDWEEEYVSGSYQPSVVDREDVGSDIEFVSADYSHVDLNSQRILLEDLSLGAYSNADVSKEDEMEKVKGSSEVSDLPANPNRSATNQTNSPADGLPRAKTARFGLNTQTLFPEQVGSEKVYIVHQYSPALRGQSSVKEHLSNHGGLETGSCLSSPKTHLPVSGFARKGAPVVKEMQGHNKVSAAMPFQCSSPSPGLAVPKSFTVKVSNGACVVLSVNEQNQTQPAPHCLENQPGSPHIRHTNIHQVPADMWAHPSPSQPTNQVEVPVGCWQSPNRLTNQVEVPIGSGLSPLTISVKTSDGNDVLVEDYP